MKSAPRFCFEGFKRRARLSQVAAYPFRGFEAIDMVGQLVMVSEVLVAKDASAYDDNQNVAVLVFLYIPG